MWTARLCLEVESWPVTSFVTLTYDDEHVPRRDDGVPVLYKRDLQLFWKRLRKALDRPLRYYACGEYGRQTWRPHYHAVVFGLGEDRADLVLKAWKQGIVQLDPFTPERAAYVAGYTVDKMTSKDDERLKGRPPEFGVMSRGTAIGSGAVAHLMKMMESPRVSRIIDDVGDIPTVVRVNRRLYPMGRTLANKARSKRGIPLLAADRKTGSIDPPTLIEVEHAKRKHEKAKRRQGAGRNRI